MKNWWLPEYDSQPVQVRHQEQGSGRISKLPRLAFDNKCNEPLRYPHRFPHDVGHPIDPLLIAQIEVDTVGPREFVRWRTENEVDRVRRLRLHPREAVRMNCSIYVHSLLNS